uniref:Uncharacterized protein n=1 Tax=Edwardsiella piscicida TaxID=1263550 RepID=A0A8F5V958_EDWPI|nr:hypothetical protein [Edwardsiella piscicida]
MLVLDNNLHVFTTNLRFWLSASSLLLCKRKNRPARRFFEGSQSSNSLSRGNWL